ncbi:Basic leucine zipper [Apiospora kogelbergensis]|uniref:Basic leucine zipper n=1 Tax=Apiospora kogelbergensis TaxID=1337665 RepID=UPI00312DEAE0
MQQSTVTVQFAPSQSCLGFFQPQQWIVGREPTYPGSGSPDSSGTQTNSRKRASPPVDSGTALKRQRNNVAAKKYRQKKIDRITELEMELKGVKDERDDLKIRLARQEAEASALRSMLRMKAGSEK